MFECSSIWRAKQKNFNVLLAGNHCFCPPKCAHSHVLQRAYSSWRAAFTSCWTEVEITEKGFNTSLATRTPVSALGRGSLRYKHHNAVVSLKTSATNSQRQRVRRVPSRYQNCRMRKRNETVEMTECFQVIAHATCKLPCIFANKPIVIVVFF